MTLGNILENLRQSHSDPLASAAFTRLEQLLGDPTDPIEEDVLKAYAEAEAQELTRQAAYYHAMQAFYHPNVAASRAAEAAVMHDLAQRL